MGYRLRNHEAGARDSGLYNLILWLKSPKTIRVGDLGEFSFPKGFYVYTGSAVRGLRRKVSRHQKRHKPKRLPIDYLRAHCSLAGLRTYSTHHKAECQLNRRILALNGAQTVIPKFGTSHCRCETHLVWFAEDDYESIREKLIEPKVETAERTVYSDNDLEKEKNSL